MINYMQTNQNSIGNINVIDNKTWDDLLNYIKKYSITNQTNQTSQTNQTKIISYFYDISNQYNIEMKTIIKDFINFIIRYKPNLYSTDFFNFVEFIIHSQDVNINYILNYTISRFCRILRDSD